MEMLISFVIQIADKINILGKIRLLDVFLLCITVYIIFKSKGVIKTSFRAIWIISIIRIIYIWATLFFLRVGDISQYLSIGYYIEFLLIFYIAENGELSFDKLWNIGLVILILNSIIAIFQFVTSGGVERGYGFVGSASGTYALPYIIYTVFNYKKVDIKHKIAVILAIVSILVSLQRTLIIITFMGITLYMVVEKSSHKYILFIKRTVGIVLISIIIWILIPMELKETIINRFKLVFTASKSLDINDSMQIRYSIWEVAMNLFYKNPIIGIGSGGFSRLTIEQFSANISRAFSISSVGLSTHNNFIEYLCEIGVIGTILTYGLCIITIKKIIVRAKRYSIQGGIYQSLLATVIALTLYDFIGQGSFFPFWSYNLMLLIVYLRCTIDNINIQNKKGELYNE